MNSILLRFSGGEERESGEAIELDRGGGKTKKGGGFSSPVVGEAKGPEVGPIQLPDTGRDPE
jgi:hypothetical protein